MICLGLVGFIGYHQQGARSWTETNDITGEYRVCQKSSDAAQMICDAWHPKQLIDPVSYTHLTLPTILRV